jgi:hypothetical protein
MVTALLRHRRPDGPKSLHVTHPIRTGAGHRELRVIGPLSERDTHDEDELPSRSNARVRSARVAVAAHAITGMRSRAQRFAT